MSELTDQIRTKGFWNVAIMPEPFVENRVDYGELEDTLIKVAVRFRGWPVPFFNHHEAPLRGPDWIGQDIDAQMLWHSEAWRFFTSGQFNHLRAISADWRTDTPQETLIPRDFGLDSVIEVWEILYYLTEVFELASRLAFTSAGDEKTRIEVRLSGMKDRGLVVGQDNRAPFMEPYKANIEDYAQSIVLTRDQIAAEARDQAVKMAREFFLRFGWNPSIDQLAEHQRELTERG
jgi:hypothetical protein